MDNPLTVVAAIAAVGALYVVVPVVADAYRRYRGTKTVICPENNQATEIQLDTAQAAASAAVGRPDLRVTGCSRWPERHHCGQECVEQLR
jgi:hypothetical protein